MHGFWEEQHTTTLTDNGTMIMYIFKGDMIFGFLELSSSRTFESSCAHTLPFLKYLFKKVLKMGT